MVIVMDNSQKTKNMFRFNLNKAMRERGVKQKDLAAALGMSENMISYYCNGDKVPNLVRLKEIAQHLNVSTDYLLGLSSNMTTDKELDFVCNYTGLSEAAIQMLRDCEADHEPYPNRLISVIADCKSESARPLFANLLFYLTSAKTALFNAETDFDIADSDALQNLVNNYKPIQNIVSLHSYNKCDYTLSKESVSRSFLQSLYLLGMYENIVTIRQELIEQNCEADNQ